MKVLNIKELVGRKKVNIILIIIVSMLCGIIYSYNFEKPKYKASTTLILGRINLIEENVNQVQTTKVSPNDIVLNTNLVSTYSELIKSNTLISEVKRNLNLKDSEDNLKKSIEIRRVSKSELLEIIVKNEDSKLASEIANEVADIFSEKIKEIYNVNKVYIIDPAHPYLEPYNINYIGNIIVFSISGFFVSIIYLYVIYKIDKTIKTSIDVENEIGIKTLISIPIKKDEKKNKTELVNLNDKKILIGKAFKDLRTNVQFANVNNKDNKIILITSCFSSEGKSFVSANLAVAFAESGKKVILIDANMRRGKQSKIFNIPNNLGLSNYLSNLDTNGIEINERINSFINETAIKNLNIITSGTVPPNPTELLESEKLLELVKDLSVFYDIIIFDGPAVLPVSDALVLTRVSNSTILVSLCNKTKKDELEKAKRDIQNVGGKIVGVVLNKVTLNNHKNENKKYYSYIFSKKTNGEENEFNIKDFFVNIKNKIKEKIEIKKRKEIKLLLNQQRENIEKRQLEKNKVVNNISEENSLNTSTKTEEKVVNQEEKLNVEENIEISKVDEKEINISPKNNISENEKSTEKENCEKEKDEDLSSELKLKDRILFNIKLNAKEIKEKIITIQNKLKTKIEEYKKQKEKDKQIKIEKFELEKQKRAEELKKEEELETQKRLEKQQAEIIQKEIEEKKKAEEEKNRLELEKIKEAEKIAKREQELIIAEQKEKQRLEQEKIKQKEKRKKEELKNEIKNKKMQEKEEKRKFRMQKKEKEKEEARIKEELLEDNLYPKTKYNKNL